MHQHKNINTSKFTKFKNLNQDYWTRPNCTNVRFIVIIISIVRKKSQWRRSGMRIVLYIGFTSLPKSLFKTPWAHKNDTYSEYKKQFTIFSSHWNLLITLVQAVARPWYLQVNRGDDSELKKRLSILSFKRCFIGVAAKV